MREKECGSCRKKWKGYSSIPLKECFSKLLIPKDNIESNFTQNIGLDSKSKVKYDGQSIYKVEKKTDNQYLKKGYGVYLDALHKDHLEVIDKTGNVKYVLNLDGTLNPDKTKKALGRVVKEWK